MKTYRVYQVDAFTRERFLGNPAGVVPNADGLTAAQMQSIARELNNSETAFIFSGGGEGYDVEVRFFTPTTEVPSCGHATISAHYVRARELGIRQETVVRQKTGAGILPVTIVPDGEDWRIIMEQGKIEVEEIAAADVHADICHALGISPDEREASCPLAIASTGHSKVMVGIRSTERLHALEPDMQALTAISRRIGCNGYYVFTLSPGQRELVHGRMFAPAIGIAEDPVTGNANGPLGAYLCHYRLLDTSGESVSFLAVQGEKIRRRGTMRVEVSLAAGRSQRVRIVGEAVIAFRTEIEM